MTAKAPTAMGPVSPWMTVTQVATYTNRHPETVYLALSEYGSTRGRSGLRGHQKRAGCRWQIHLDDVEAKLGLQMRGWILLVGDEVAEPFA